MALSASTRSWTVFAASLIIGVCVGLGVRTGYSFVKNREDIEIIAPEDDAILQNYRAVRTVNLETVGTFNDTLAFALINDIEVFDTVLVVTDAFSESLLQVWDIRQRQPIARLGPKGRGPGEFLSPLSIRKEGNNSFWIYDNSLGRLSRYSLLRLHDGPDSIVGISPMLAQVAWRGDTLIANGVFPRHLIRKYTGTGSYLRPVGEFGLSPFSYRKDLQQMLLQRTLMASDPATSVFAIAFMTVDRIYVYDRLGLRIGAGTGARRIEPVFQFSTNASRTGGLARSRYTKWAYKDVVVRQDKIYALFSGRSKEEPAGAVYAANEIHIFDFKGKLLEIWRLDKDVRAIALADSIMYGATIDPYPDIAMFRLPDFH